MQRQWKGMGVEPLTPHTLYKHIDIDEQTLPVSCIYTVPSVNVNNRFIQQLRSCNQNPTVLGM